MKTTYYLGIDPGVNTGVALWNRVERKLVLVKTMKIHKAFDFLREFPHGTDITVRFEDARLRSWFGKAGREQLQGAGSIKRDCGIWEDFLTDNNIPFQVVAPKNNRTKLPPEKFSRMTGFTGKTSEHGRDAAMLVFGI